MARWFSSSDSMRVLAVWAWLLVMRDNGMSGGGRRLRAMLCDKVYEQQGQRKWVRIEVLLNEVSILLGFCAVWASRLT
jgi:hypothetical protein